MPLVKCPDCGRDVSDRSPSCLQCGAPIAPAATPVEAQASTVPLPVRQRVQTIERTSKKYKRAQLLGVLSIIVGMASCSLRSPMVAAWCWLGGIVVFIGARIGSWWDNG